jgi:hypothetical protein
MPIYDIVTSDNVERKYWDKEEYEDYDFFHDILPGQLYFRTNSNPIDDGNVSGLTVVTSDQMIQMTKHETMPYKEEIAYIIKPSGISIELDIFRGDRVGYIRIKGPSFYMYDSLDDENVETIFNEFKSHMAKLITKKVGRNVGSTLALETLKGLPKNVGGKIGEMLSGKKGHLESQMNQLKQNVGIPLAPRVRAAKGSPLAGGKRRTRKRHM